MPALNGIPRDAWRPLGRLLRRRSLSWIVAVLALPALAGAQDQQAFLELIVNGVPSGEQLVVLRDDDVLIGVAALTDAGLQRFEGRRARVADREFVSLASLAPALTFAVDERELRLRIDAEAGLLGERVRSLRGPRPRDLVYRGDMSAFVNYAVGWSGGAQYDVVAESGASIGGVLLHNTLSATSRGVLRGLSSVIVDERSRMRRWTIGDSFAQTGLLGGGSFIAGINLSREFGVDPYFVRHPSLSLATPVTTPSIVEVYVNDRLVGQEQVAPGRLDLQDLPVTSGRNDARVVVRDAFGGTREFSTQYYVSTSALARGVHSYQYSVGWTRESLGSESWQYASPALLATHRVGLTDVVTAGGRLEAAAGLVSGGPSINLRLPIGEVEGAAAFSGTSGGLGTASALSYVYAGAPVSGGASFRWYGERYATVRPTGRDERPARELSVFASVPIAPRVTLTVRHGDDALRNGLSRGRTGLLASARLTKHADLLVSTARVRSEEGRHHEVFVGITMPFGRASATASVVRDAAGGRASMDVMRSLPLGPGYGYQLRAESGSRDLVSGAAFLQGPYGRYELRRELLNGTEQFRVQAAGALVGIGGGLYAARPVRNSFALVQVPGVEGVRGFVSNQEIGQTDAGGNLLVPELEAYYGNILRIADEDIPLDYSIGGTRLTLAPPFRGGALAVFPVRPTRRITGVVRIADGGRERVPAHGRLTLTIDGEPSISPVGTQGEFYFEELASGSFPALVEDGHGSCAFMLDVPADETPAVDLGSIRCTVVEGP